MLFALLGVVAVVGLGAAAFFLLGGDDDSEAADGTTVTTVVEAADGNEVDTTEPTAAEPATSTTLPAGAPIFTGVFDDSGVLFAEVPDDWEVDGAAVDGAENLEVTGDKGTLLMFPLITEETPAVQAGILIEGWECEMDGTPYDYDDGLFVGVGAKYTCPNAPKMKGEVLVVEHPEGDRLMVDSFVRGGVEGDLIRDKFFESFNLKL